MPPIIRAIPPKVELVYAIGDVHGRADLLAWLLAAIDVAAQGRRTAVVFLGDLVDRGPDSCAVLDLAIGTLERLPDSLLCLGNHDDWFLKFLQDDAATGEDLDLWLDQGGAETLRSYGLEKGAAADLRAAVLEAHPGHLPLLRNAAIIATWGEFAFVHAGIDPSQPLADQTIHDCLWIRAPFLRHVGRLDWIVVHGHSPQKPPRPHMTENRISLDTGAVFSNILTAAEFDRVRQTVRFLSPGREGTLERIEPVRVDRGLGTVLAAEKEPDSGLYELPTQKGAAQGPPSLAGVSGHEKPNTA